VINKFLKKETRIQAVIYKNYATVDVLELLQVAKPIPKDNEVLIRVRAAEATKSDCEMRSFKFAVSWFWLPLRIALGITKPKDQILGGYFAG
jgi:NADPH:quinone reductase-like Zn-dependent oxidoreductase